MLDKKVTIVEYSEWNDTSIGDLYSWRKGFQAALDEILKILNNRPITCKEEIQLLKEKMK